MKAKSGMKVKKKAAPKAKKGMKLKKANFGMLSVKAGIDNNPKPTQADRIAGATKGKKKKPMAKKGSKVMKAKKGSMVKKSAKKKMVKRKY